MRIGVSGGGLFKRAHSTSIRTFRSKISPFGAILGALLCLGASASSAGEMTSLGCNAALTPKSNVEGIRAASRKTLCHFDLTESMKKSLRCLSDNTDSFTTRYQPLEVIELEISKCYRTDIVPELEKDPEKRKKLEEQVKSEAETLKTIAVAQMAEKLEEVARQIDLKQTVGIELSPDEKKWLADIKKRIEETPAVLLPPSKTPVAEKPAPTAEQVRTDLERAGVHLDKSGLGFEDFPFLELQRPGSRQADAIRQAFGSRTDSIIAGINELYSKPRVLGPNEFGTRRLAFAIGNSVIVPGRWPDMGNAKPRVMSIETYNRKVKAKMRDFDDEIRKSREASQSGAGFWASLTSSSIQRHADASLSSWVKANDIMSELKMDYGVETKLGDRLLQSSVKAMSENGADLDKVMENIETAKDATIGIGVTAGVIATGGLLAGPVLGISGTSVVIGMTTGVVAGAVISGGVKAAEAVVGSYDMSDALCRGFAALTQGMATAASIPGISKGEALERIKKSYDEGGSLGLIGHLMSLGPTQAVLGLVTPGFTKLLARAGTPVIEGTLTGLGKSASTIAKAAQYSGKLAGTAVTAGFAVPTLPGAWKGVTTFVDRQADANKLSQLEVNAKSADDRERYARLGGEARMESYHAIVEAAGAIGPAAFPHLLHPINSATTHVIETIVAKFEGGRTPAKKPAPAVPPVTSAPKGPLAPVGPPALPAAAGAHQKYSRVQIESMSIEELNSRVQIRPTVGGYIAYIGETPVGRMLVSEVRGRDGKPKAHQIGTVWLIPEARGRGVGTALYQEVARRAPNGTLLSDGSVTDAAVGAWTRMAEGEGGFQVTDMRPHIEDYQQLQREKVANGGRISAWRNLAKTMEVRPKFILRTKSGRIEGEGPIVKASAAERERHESIMNELKVDAAEYDNPLAAVQPQTPAEIRTGKAEFVELESALGRAGTASAQILAHAFSQKPLGAGGGFRVYAIPGVPDYVARVPKHEPVRLDGKLTATEAWAPGWNFGQAVGKVGNIEICKRQGGQPSGLALAPMIEPPGSPARARAIAEFVDSQRAISEMPFDRFRTLMRDQELARLRGRAVDASPGNLLVEPGKRFNLVDVQPLAGDRQPLFDPGRDAVAMLLDADYSTTYAGSGPEITAVRQKTLYKVLGALRAEGFDLTRDHRKLEAAFRSADMPFTTTEAFLYLRERSSLAPERIAVIERGLRESIGKVPVPKQASAEVRAIRQKLRAEYEADIKLYSPEGASPDSVKYQAALQNRAHVGRLLRDIARFRKELRAAGVDLAVLKSGIVISDVGKSARAMKEVIERAIRDKFPKKKTEANPKGIWTEGDYFAAFLNHEKYGLDLLESAGLHPDEAKMVREAVIGHNGPGTKDSWWGKNWEMIMGGDYQSIQAKEGFVHGVVDRVDGAIVELNSTRDAVVGGLSKIIYDEWSKFDDRASPEAFAKIVKEVVGSTQAVQGQLNETARLAIEQGRNNGDAGLVQLFEGKDGFFAAQNKRLSEMKALTAGPDAPVKVVDGKVFVDGVLAGDPEQFFGLLVPVLKRGVAVPPEPLARAKEVVRPPPPSATALSRLRVPDLSTFGTLQNVGRRKPLPPEYWAYKFVQEMHGIPQVQRVSIIEGLQARLSTIPTSGTDAIFISRVLEGLTSPQMQEKLMRDSHAYEIEGTGLKDRAGEDHGVRTAVETAVSDLVWGKRTLSALKLEQSFDDVIHSYVDLKKKSGLNPPGVKPRVTQAIERSVAQAQELLTENGMTSHIAGYHEDAVLGRIPYLEVTGGGNTRLGRMITDRIRVKPGDKPGQTQTRFLFDPYDSLNTVPTSHRDPDSNALYLSGRALATPDTVLPGVQGELAALRFQHDLMDSQARLVDATVFSHGKDGSSVELAGSASTVAKVTKAFSSVGGLERVMGGAAEAGPRLIGARLGHEGAAVETSARVEFAKDALKLELSGLRSAQKMLSRGRLKPGELERLQREGTLSVQIAGSGGEVQDVVIRWNGADGKGDLKAVQAAVKHRIEVLAHQSKRLELAEKRANKLEDLASGVHDDAPLEIPESIHRSWKERVKRMRLPGIDLPRILNPRGRAPAKRHYDIPDLIKKGTLDQQTIQAFTTHQGQKLANALHGELLRIEEGDLIIDSNIAIDLARAMEGKPRLKTAQIERLKGFLARHPRKILVTDVSALEILNKLGADSPRTVEGFQLPGIQLKIKNRGDKNYRRILEQLADKPEAGAGKAVGGANGTQDRVIVADVFFARRAGSISPSFLTADHGIYRRLFQLAKLPGRNVPTHPDALAEYIRTQFPDGFLCTLNDGKGDRTIRVIPAAEPQLETHPFAPATAAAAAPVLVEEGTFFKVTRTGDGVEKTLKSEIRTDGGRKTYVPNSHERTWVIETTIEQHNQIADALGHGIVPRLSRGPGDRLHQALAPGLKLSELKTADLIIKASDQAHALIRKAWKALKPDYKEGDYFEAEAIPGRLWKLEIDDNMLNFRFDEAGNVIGWFDPIALYPPSESISAGRH